MARLQDSGQGLGAAHDRGLLAKQGAGATHRCRMRCGALHDLFAALSTAGGACWRGSVSGCGEGRNNRRWGVLQTLYMRSVATSKPLVGVYALQLLIWALMLALWFFLSRPPLRAFFFPIASAALPDHSDCTQPSKFAMLAAGRLAPAAAQPAVLTHCRRLQHARLKLIVPQRALAAGNPAFSPPAAAPRAAAPGATAAPRPSKTTPRLWRCGAVQQLSSAAAVDAAAGRLAAAAAPLRVIGPGEVHLWWLDPSKVGARAIGCNRVDGFGASRSRHASPHNGDPIPSHPCTRSLLRPAALRSWPAAPSCSPRRSCSTAARRGRRTCSGSASWHAPSSGADRGSWPGWPLPGTLLPGWELILSAHQYMLWTALLPPARPISQVCAGWVPPRLPAPTLPALWPQPARQARAAGAPHHRRRPPSALQPHAHWRHDWAGGHRWGGLERVGGRRLAASNI